MYKKYAFSQSKINVNIFYNHAYNLSYNLATYFCNLNRKKIKIQKISRNIQILKDKSVCKIKHIHIHNIKVTKNCYTKLKFSKSLISTHASIRIIKY